MKEISHIEVKQIRIFKADQIPYSSLVTATPIQDIVNSFGCGMDNQFSSGLRFIRGEYKTKKKNLTIEELTIQPQRIYFSVNGDSQDADQFYKELGKLISRYDYGKFFSPDKYLTKTEETSCVANLDIKHEKMFNKQFLNYVQRDIPEIVSDNNAEAFLSFFNVRFKYKYNVRNPVIREHGVTFTDKYFIMEPREGSVLGDSRYYTHSPTDSNTHLKLIEEIENKFKS